jgi:hypothetical protein
MADDCHNKLGPLFCGHYSLGLAHMDGRWTIILLPFHLCRTNTNVRRFLRRCLGKGGVSRYKMYSKHNILKLKRLFSFTHITCQIFYAIPTITRFNATVVMVSIPTTLFVHNFHHLHNDADCIGNGHLVHLDNLFIQTCANTIPPLFWDVKIFF